MKTIKANANERISLKIVNDDNTPYDLTDFFTETGIMYINYRKKTDKNNSEWITKTDIELTSATNGEIIWVIDEEEFKGKQGIFEFELIGEKFLFENEFMSGTSERVRMPTKDTSFIEIMVLKASSTLQN
jgi:hypothetical protein